MPFAGTPSAQMMYPMPMLSPTGGAPQTPGSYSRQPPPPGLQAPPPGFTWAPELPTEAMSPSKARFSTPSDLSTLTPERYGPGMGASISRAVSSPRSNVLIRPPPGLPPPPGIDLEVPLAGSASGASRTLTEEEIELELAMEALEGDISKLTEARDGEIRKALLIDEELQNARKAKIDKSDRHQAEAYARAVEQLKAERLAAMKQSMALDSELQAKQTKLGELKTKKQQASQRSASMSPRKLGTPIAAGASNLSPAFAGSFTASPTSRAAIPLGRTQPSDSDSFAALAKSQGMDSDLVQKLQEELEQEREAAKNWQAVAEEATAAVAKVCPAVLSICFELQAYTPFGDRFAKKSTSAPSGPSGVLKRLKRKRQTNCLRLKKSFAVRRPW